VVVHLASAHREGALQLLRTVQSGVHVYSGLLALYDPFLSMIGSNA
jgi:hypothetical protein